MWSAPVLPTLGTMKRSLDHLRQGLHSLKDLAWYGSSCRCGLWVVVTRVPGDPLLAAILPWHKPFAWWWAREELTEALIEQWPQSSWTASPESHPVMLALCHAKASRLLEDALAEGDLAIVHRD